MDVLMVVAIFTILLVAIWLFFPSRSKARKPLPGAMKSVNVGARSDKAEATRWRSIEVLPGLICCDGVSKIANRVYLATEAPSFPLGDCTEKACQCRYKYLDDRRAGEDRRSKLVHLGDFFLNNQSVNRRVTLGRRAINLGT